MAHAWPLSTSRVSSLHSVSSLSDYDITPAEAEHSTENDSIRKAPSIGSVHGETCHLENESTLNERLPITESSKDDASPCHTIKKSNLHPITILTDCAAIIAPMAIICILIAVLNLNNRAVRSIALNAWLDTLTVLATLFPFLFASIAGRMTSAAAQWKLERGTSIKYAELLHGSRTLGGTLLTLVQLRYINILSLVLFILWATSPLGSQSFLRIASIQLQNESQLTTIKYGNTDVPIGKESTKRSKNAGSLRSLSIKTTYTSLLMEPKNNKLNPMDTWGNIKIPFFHPENDSPEDMDESWKSTTQTESEIQYASLLGVPVDLGPTPGNISFPLESSYLHLECLNMTVLKPHETLQAISPISGGRRPKVVNSTWQGLKANAIYPETNGDSAIWGIALDGFVDESWFSRSEACPAIMKNASDLKTRPTNLFFQVPSVSRGSKRAFNAFETTCRVTQRYIESQVHCSSIVASQKSCTVAAQRLSRQQHAPEDISQLSFPKNFRFLSSELPRMVSGLGMKFPGDISLQYLVDPFMDQLMGMKDLDVNSFDGTIFSTRLSQILNTYIMVNQFSPFATAGDIDDDMLNELEVQRDKLVEHVAISPLWISISLITCVALLLSGILSVVFTHRSIGPDILGYVSTAIRDSRFIDIPEKTRWLGGLDLTLGISDRSIRLGMIQTSSDQTPLLGVGETANVKGLDTVLEWK